MLLTPDEVVTRYRNSICIRTLANWRSLGIGPDHIKIGKAILYPVDKLIEWEQRGGDRERRRRQV